MWTAQRNSWNRAINLKSVLTQCRAFCLLPMLTWDQKQPLLYSTALDEKLTLFPQVSTAAFLHFWQE